MSTLKWIALWVAAGYLGIGALMYFAQRSLMYFPDRTRTPPAAAGFPQAQEVTLDTADGETRDRLACAAARRASRWCSISTAMAAR